MTKSYKTTKALAEKALAGYLEEVKGPLSLMRSMKYVVMSGGKRLRAVLTIESSRTLGGGAKKALPFACAIELIHNFSLVHDDLPAMDNDDFRRGKPTCHKKFNEATAILAGDALLALAFKIAAGTKHPKASSIIVRISEAIGARGMIGGQVLDIDQANNRKTSRSSSLKQRIDTMKTASLMAVSCEAGGMAAEGGPKDIARMREFGKNLGLAFQIADDIDDFETGEQSLEGMKKKGRTLIQKAKQQITPFGKKATTLIDIAETIKVKCS